MRELNIKKILGVKPALLPQRLSGSSDVVGVEIDTHGDGAQKWGVALLNVVVGATTGTPTSFSATFRMQESEVSGSGFADFADTDNVNSLGVALTAVNTNGQLVVDLRGTKRFVRVVALPAFVAGTSPTVEASATIVLGEPRFI